MAKYVKTFAEFITEAAAWDDASKVQVDKRFLSFDDKEKYEVRDFVNLIMKKYLGKEIDKDELLKVIMKCKDESAHNHPRKEILQCVLKQYDIELTD